MSDATIAFIENAFRNINFPPLSPDDLEDIGGALAHVIKAAERRGEGVMRERVVKMVDKRAAEHDEDYEQSGGDMRALSARLTCEALATAIRALPCPTEQPGAIPTDTDSKEPT